MCVCVCECVREKKRTCSVYQLEHASSDAVFFACPPFANKEGGFLYQLDSHGKEKWIRPWYLCTHPVSV